MSGKVLSVVIKCIWSEYLDKPCSPLNLGWILPPAHNYAKRNFPTSLSASLPNEFTADSLPVRWGRGREGFVLGHWPGWWYCLVHTSLESCKFFSLIIQSASYSTMCTLCLLPFDNLFSEGGQMQEYYKVSVWSVQFLVQLLRQPMPLGLEASEAHASFLVLVAITQTPFLSPCWP